MIGLTFGQMMSKLLDIDAIEARANASTPGPWCEHPNGSSVWSGTEYDCEDMSQRHVANTRQDERGVVDAEFIAHARQDIPSLLAEVKHLRGLSHASQTQIDLNSASKNLLLCDPVLTDKLAWQMLRELRALRAFLDVVTRERDHAQLVEVPDALDQRDNVLELLREITRPVCVDCECLLTGVVDLDSDSPPHCEHCNVEHEDMVKWENETQPKLLRRIEEVRCLVTTEEG